MTDPTPEQIAVLDDMAADLAALEAASTPTEQEKPMTADTAKPLPWTRALKAAETRIRAAWENSRNFDEARELALSAYKILHNLIANQPDSRPQPTPPEGEPDFALVIKGFNDYEKAMGDGDDLAAMQHYETFAIILRRFGLAAPPEGEPDYMRDAETFARKEAAPLGIEKYLRKFGERMYRLGQRSAARQRQKDFKKLARDILEAHGVSGADYSENAVASELERVYHLGLAARQRQKD